jgi:hypothetical protein
MHVQREEQQQSNSNHHELLSLFFFVAARLFLGVVSIDAIHLSHRFVGTKPVS